MSFEILHGFFTGIPTCAVGGAHHIEEVGEDGEAHVARGFQHPVAGQVLRGGHHGAMAIRKWVISWDLAMNKW